MTAPVFVTFSTIEKKILKETFAFFCRSLDIDSAPPCGVRITNDPEAAAASCELGVKYEQEIQTIVSATLCDANEKNLKPVGIF